MATKTQTASSPFSRLSRLGLGFGSKPHSPTSKGSHRNSEKVNDDDWYTPYNGPYEAPRHVPRKDERKRDSWGDPVYDEPSYETDVLGDELLRRYGAPEQHDAVIRGTQDPRTRTQSGFSGRTVSSDMVDPQRTSRSFASSSHPKVNAHSFSSAGPSGGVGESPIPQPVNRERQRRSTLATLFFGSTSIKRSSSSNNPAPILSTSTLHTSPSKHGLKHSPAKSNSSFSGTDSPLSQLATPIHQGRSDVIHVYKPDQHQSLDSRHPYASAFPTPESPHTPLSAPPHAPFHSIPAAPVMQPPSRSFNPNPAAAASKRSLKNSISTPDLRSAGSQHARSSAASRKPLSKVKDRWLSAETWCDALLFPRPRFKVQEYGGNARIVSPPDSPVRGDFLDVTPSQPAVVSRVLAHSRSLVDLNKPSTSARPNGMLQRPPSTYLDPRTSRPKSFAWDDLALPSPVPSLSKVLEEGQILEHQRKKWQAQATNSFQNKRTRSVSRARSKSLTGKQAQKEFGVSDNDRPSNFDFLAARALLGSQQTVPPSIIRTSAPSSDHDSKLTWSRVSHSHSSSLSKSKTSSKAHSRGHSHSDSISKKMVKALCGVDDGNMLTPGVECRKVELADHFRPQSNLSNHRNDISPTPSGISDSQIGLAISTPPNDIDPIRFPAHPYAQGVVYSYVAERGTDYAGPHPIAKSALPDSLHAPPHRHHVQPASSHPYASTYLSSQEVLITRDRADSQVPAPSKMWAPLSPGVVREVLPHEFQYSPYISETHSTSSSRLAPARKDNVLDTIGVGEALAYAMQQQRMSRDSGLGTSEDHPHHDESEASNVHAYRPQRQPVQYDPSAGRPSHTLLGHHVQFRTLDTIYSTETNEASSSSHGLTAEAIARNEPSPGSSSPDDSGMLGKEEELPNEHFKDLFYRPSGPSQAPSGASPRPQLTRNHSLPWSVASGSVRSGSGLASLARQLTEEFEEMTASDSMYTNRTSITTNPGFQFVLTDHQDSAPLVDDAMSHFKFRPSVKIPEDVESIASSMMERSPIENNDVDNVRLGFVESVLTPPVVSSDHRTSLTGHMSYSNSSALIEEDEEPTITLRPPIVTSNQHSPTSEGTRSSYMTTSSMQSRMSGLSDFPIPPPNDVTPAHMNVLGSYFSNSESASIEYNKRSTRRTTFGTDQDIEELLTNLSQR